MSDVEEMYNYVLAFGGILPADLIPQELGELPVVSQGEHADAVKLTRVVMLTTITSLTYNKTLRLKTMTFQSNLGTALPPEREPTHTFSYGLQPLPPPSLRRAFAPPPSQGSYMDIALTCHPAADYRVRQGGRCLRRIRRTRQHVIRLLESDSTRLCINDVRVRGSTNTPPPPPPVWPDASCMIQQAGRCKRRARELASALRQPVDPIDQDSALDAEGHH